MKTKVLKGDEGMEQFKDDTAKKILIEATKLFAEKGYKGVSVREILQAAEVGNIGAISYYFGGKRELYLAILREHFKNAHKIADVINQKESSPIKKLEKIFSAISTTYKNSPYTIKLLFSEINNPSEFFPVIDSELKDLQKVSRNIIQAGMDAKIFRADVNPESMTLVLFSIAHFVFLMPNFAKNLLTDKTFEDYLAQAQEIFFRGIMR